MIKNIYFSLVFMCVQYWFHYYLLHIICAQYACALLYANWILLIFYFTCYYKNCNMFAKFILLYDQNLPIICRILSKYANKIKTPSKFVTYLSKFYLLPIKPSLKKFFLPICDLCIILVTHFCNITLYAAQKK